MILRLSTSKQASQTQFGNFNLQIQTGQVTLKTLYENIFRFSGDDCSIYLTIASIPGIEFYDYYIFRHRGQNEVDSALRKEPPQALCDKPFLCRNAPPYLTLEGVDDDKDK